MISAHNLFDSEKTSYNPFEEENNNTNRIQALLLVQTDLVRDILNNRERDLIKHVIIKGHSRTETAKLFGVSKSTITREVKRATYKLQKYLHYCDLALRYYESNNAS